ncbi:hypothetical protein GCM10015535_36030 [Streptomyces gelaticus]|uniref:DUF58 domain-containing protein n=1 Tax=Streptomyces gelaticus TaxID=285446 RepID=A0ABQ2W2U6_9ACTN|nr:hypothetical protein [Streptomyces gelaticus]GGV87053.1 hypothetical protein GCM10015535_36030 [Streptomyces gelaticus]
MSLPVIAIVIASASAVFTGSNMVISALTYRRVRPRVEVDSRWGLLGDLERPRKGKNTFGFRLHVKNVSPTAAKVESVHVVGWMPLRYPLKKMFRKPWPKRRVPVRQEIKVPRVGAARSLKAPNMELPAFGGLSWEIPYDFETISPAPGWGSVTVVVRLTSGEEVHGKRISRSALDDQIKRINGYYPELGLSSPSV